MLCVFSVLRPPHTSIHRDTRVLGTTTTGTPVTPSRGPFFPFVQTPSTRKRTGRSTPLRPEVLGLQKEEVQEGRVGKTIVYSLLVPTRTIPRVWYFRSGRDPRVENGRSGYVQGPRYWTPVVGGRGYLSLHPIRPDPTRFGSDPTPVASRRRAEERGKHPTLTGKTGPVRCPEPPDRFPRNRTNIKEVKEKQKGDPR